MVSNLNTSFYLVCVLVGHLPEMWFLLRYEEDLSHMSRGDALIVLLMLKTYSYISNRLRDFHFPIQLTVKRISRTIRFSDGLYCSAKRLI